MSDLTLRRWTKADEALLPSIDASVRPDIRGINSPETHTCICLEGKAVVGIAMGFAPKGAVATLAYCRSLIAGRNDILLAMAEWHNNNAIKLGYKTAEITIPYSGQCTNVQTTANLKTYIAGKVPTVAFEPSGKDMANAGAVVAEKMDSPDLEAASKTLAAALDKLGCKRTWV